MHTALLHLYFLDLVFFFFKEKNSDTLQIPTASAFSIRNTVHITEGDEIHVNPSCHSSPTLVCKSQVDPSQRCLPDLISYSFTYMYAYCSEKKVYFGHETYMYITIHLIRLKTLPLSSLLISFLFICIFKSI